MLKEDSQRANEIQTGDTKNAQNNGSVRLVRGFSDFILPDRLIIKLNFFVKSLPFRDTFGRFLSPSSETFRRLLKVTPITFHPTLLLLLSELS
jgi:hypothetical protein